MSCLPPQYTMCRAWGSVGAGVSGVAFSAIWMMRRMGRGRGLRTVYHMKSLERLGRAMQKAEGIESSKDEDVGSCDLPHLSERLPPALRLSSLDYI